MSITPGEFPGIGVTGTERQYDHRAVEMHLIWPLVSLHYRGGKDFRETHATAQLNVRKNDIFNGCEYDVLLRAEHDVFGGDENTHTGVPSLTTAYLEVEEVVYDHRRGVILSAAREQSKKVREEDEVDLRTKVGACFRFDTDGDGYVEIKQIVEDFEGFMIWPEADEPYDNGAEDDSDGEDIDTEKDSEERVIIKPWTEVRLFDQDMELIEAGIYLLNPTRGIKKALEIIRANPIKV
jgi:hypothetical protein